MIEKAIADNNLNLAAVLSGNRNFEARIHQRIQSNFLASPMLVVAFALVGQIDIELTYGPLGFDPNGEPVYLEDIWPESEEIEATGRRHVKKEFFELEYGRIFDGDEFWQGLPEVESVTYAWDDQTIIYYESALFRRVRYGTGKDRRHRKCPDPGAGRRYHHNRPHFPAFLAKPASVFC